MSLYPDEALVVEILRPSRFPACVPHHAEFFLESYFLIPAVRCNCGSRVLLFDDDVRPLTPATEELFGAGLWKKAKWLAVWKRV